VISNRETRLRSSGLSRRTIRPGPHWGSLCRRRRHGKSPRIRTDGTPTSHWLAGHPSARQQPTVPGRRRRSRGAARSRCRSGGSLRRVVRAAGGPADAVAGEQARRHPDGFGAETAAAVMSRPTSGSANWRSAIAAYDGPFAFSSRLSPNRASRASSASSLSPRRRSPPSSRATPRLWPRVAPPPSSVWIAQRAGPA
jgi:hypothetical protein